MQELDLLFIGFGSVHQALAHILLAKGEILAERYGVYLRVVGVADSGGARLAPQGLDLAALLAHKAKGESVARFSSGQPVPHGVALAQIADYDLLLEASPVNLRSGEPGLGCVRAALRRGKGAILANKGPLVLDFSGLQDLASRRQAYLAFSATVCGGLPVVNVGRRDLVAATIDRLEGIFNSTTNYILTRMASGDDYASALQEAQRRGIAETDPSLDVEGWDTANKLVILANAVLGFPASLDDVSVRGIRDLLPRDLTRVQDEGKVMKLVASAQREGRGYTLQVAPQALPKDSFLGGVAGWEMGIVFHTDIYEDIYLKVDERQPTATAAAMLRDTISYLAASGFNTP